MTATDRHYMMICVSADYRVSRRPMQWTKGTFILWLHCGCPSKVKRKRQ